SDLGGGMVSAISPLPNVLVTWGGVLALTAMLVAFVRLLRVRPRAFLAHPVVTAAGFAVTGYLAGWLPWLVTVSRTAVFQFYLVVSSPFLTIALAIALAVISGRLAFPAV